MYGLAKYRQKVKPHMYGLEKLTGAGARMSSLQPSRCADPNAAGVWVICGSFGLRDEWRRSGVVNGRGGGNARG